MSMVNAGHYISLYIEIFALVLRNFAITLLILLVIAHLTRVFALSLPAKKFQYVPWVVGLAVVGVVVNLFLSEALTSLASFMLANVDMTSGLSEVDGSFLGYIEVITTPTLLPVTVETVSATAITDFISIAGSAFIHMIGGAIIVQAKPTFKGVVTEFAAIFKSCWWIVLAVVVALTALFTCLTFTDVNIIVPFIGPCKLVFVTLILLLIRFRIYKKRS